MPSRVWYLIPERRLVAVSLLMVAIFSPAGLVGQTLPIPSGTSEAQIREEAEREATTFPRLEADTDGAQPRTCVNTHDMGPALSGEFTIGGNLGGVSAMRAGRPGKVWWAPLYGTRDMPPLLVRGRSLTNPRDTVRFASSTVAWPVVPGAAPIPEAQRKYFFPSGITIPQAGRWLLVATSGRSWGCFILTVF